MPTDTTAMTQADSLRLVAEWLDRHPEFTLYDPTLDAIAIGDTDHAAHVRALIDGAPVGAVTKDYADTIMKAQRQFGAVRVQAIVMRDAVCTQEVVGTETIDVPDDTSPEAMRVRELEAQLDAARAQVPTFRAERDVTEWRCAPTLAIGADRDATDTENRNGLADAIAAVGNCGDVLDHGNLHRICARKPHRGDPAHHAGNVTWTRNRLGGLTGVAVGADLEDIDGWLSGASDEPERDNLEVDAS